MWAPSAGGGRDPLHPQHGELLGPRPQSTAQPWGAIGLEWLLPSPPPAENFEDDVPTVLNNPYGYGLDQPQVADEAFYVRRAQEA